MHALAQCHWPHTFRGGFRNISNNITMLIRIAIALSLLLTDQMTESTDRMKGITLLSVESNIERATIAAAHPSCDSRNMYAPAGCRCLSGCAGWVAALDCQASSLPSLTVHSNYINVIRRHSTLLLQDLDVGG
jgi:hypothetical protein